jgi:hypothetical protein
VALNLPVLFATFWPNVATLLPVVGYLKIYNISLETNTYLEIEFYFLPATMSTECL